MTASLLKLTSLIVCPGFHLISSFLSILHSIHLNIWWLLYRVCKMKHLTPAYTSSDHRLIPPNPPLWTPPTLTSSSYVPANRECARCWNKLNCGMVQEGEREREGGRERERESARSKCHSHISCAGSPQWAASAALRAPCTRPERIFPIKRRNKKVDSTLASVLMGGWSFALCVFT